MRDASALWSGFATNLKDDCLRKNISNKRVYLIVQKCNVLYSDEWCFKRDNVKKPYFAN